MYLKQLQEIGTELDHLTESSGRNNLRDDNRNRSRSRDRYDSRDHPINNYRDRDRGKSNSRNERNGRRKQQRSGPGQRNFDNNEFCNFCNIAGVIFPDWVGEIHTAQSQRLDRRQRTRISNILS